VEKLCHGLLSKSSVKRSQIDYGTNDNATHASRHQVGKEATHQPVSLSEMIDQPYDENYLSSK
jgi:hypothetical protein